MACEAHAAEFVRAAIEAGADPAPHAKFFGGSQEAAEFISAMSEAGRFNFRERFARACAWSASLKPSRETFAERRCPPKLTRLRGGTEMLYYLFYEVLRPYFKALNVFRYITVRTAYASLTALFLALVLGPWLIRRLGELQIGQFIREEGPKSHQSKAGTPTMGGVLIVIATAVPTLLWADLRNAYILLALGAMLAFCGHRFH